MKDKFLLPSILVGLLQAVLLFLTMDLFYWSTVSEFIHNLSSFIYEESLWLFPCVLSVLFGGIYAAPMLLFTKKRNMLFYFLCTFGFFLLFAVFFFAVVYALPEQVAHIDIDLEEFVPGEWEGLLLGLTLMFFSLPYFLFTALAKLVAHLVFLALHLVRAHRQRRSISN